MLGKTSTHSFSVVKVPEEAWYATLLKVRHLIFIELPVDFKGLKFIILVYFCIISYLEKNELNRGIS